MNKKDIRPQEKFGEADLVAYALISVYSNRISCDRVARWDNSSKCVNSNQVGCELDNFVVCGDLSKFGAQCNFVGK